MEVDITQFPKYFKDLPYAQQSAKQILDLILPQGINFPPLVIFVHGGGWIHGGKREDVIQSIFKVVSQGYALASVEYRFSDEKLWPAQLYDIKAAIRFLRDKRR